MLSGEELTDVHRAVLAKLCRATKGSKHAHVPRAYFMRGFERREDNPDRALHELISWGFIGTHPTGGETTYELRPLGLEICRELKRALLNIR